MLTPLSQIKSILALTVVFVLAICSGSLRVDAADGEGSALPLKIQGCSPNKDYALPRDVAKVMKSVVIVQDGADIGSGVVVSPQGYILTAAHLVRDSKQVAVYLNSGETVRGTVLRVDPTQDIALIKIKAYPHCLAVEEKLPPVGSRIFSIGFLPVQNAGFQVKEGKIGNYRFSREKAPAYLQTTLDLKPGSSGGPLLNHRGHVVGIISWKIDFAEKPALSFGSVLGHAEQSMQISWEF